ncbi:myb-like protein X isoform X2 [Lucilia cuprina]|uniref:myb-like protein X isoform X2 n=1 Tax=Lucilia cuprina TaxID=7375 RepID=UPI001F06A993|nr:myb-like protein X isoform X2 [Lucilia cuprina]
MTDNASFTMFMEINSQRIPLDIGQLYLLGKQNEESINKSNNFIQLESEEDIEHKHCVIEVGHGEDVYVFDLFSSKGTLVNNTLLKGLEKLRLKNGDILKVGKQEIKFYHDQQEVSHDSSGFLEVNKNTSDIIPSSPDSTSQHESRIKRANYNNFLVPALPTKKSVTPNNSLVIPETEAANANRNSLNISTNSRRSDSFTIPETQYCRARNSLNASDISIAESNPNVSGNKIKFNFGNLDDFDNDDDDFCIPETQEVLPAGGGISSSQRPRLLSEVKEKSILLEESTKEEAGESTNEIDGSQFRICTQDYNEGFGEEADQGLHSQIIPIIKHHTVILNTTAKSCNENVKNQSNLEEDKEISSVKWSNSRIDQETTALRADCSTPDIVDFENLQPDAAKAKEPDNITKSNLEEMLNMPVEDEEDLLPTQAFIPLGTKHMGNKGSNVEDKPCLENEKEEVLTLSDKENRCPVTLEPITDVPPTQLFEIPSSSRSNTSSTSRNSLTTTANDNKNKSKSILDIDADEEDDLLTQAFLQPTNAPSTSNAAAHKIIPIKCFNSTVLEDKLNVKNPATFFAEMEKTPLKPKSPPVSYFKVPVLKKTSSATSTTSETDLDLLMCTPQLIKEHLHVDQTEDLRKNILAVRNKHLFGDDTDEEEKEEDDDQSDLVKLINIPKDSLDFDKLLPHLKNQTEAGKLNKEKQAAKEAQKVYKFNISFGKEQDKNQAKAAQSKSSQVSRDERHAARDKEREINERKGRSKTKDSNRNHSKDQSKEKSQERKTKQKETKTKKAPPSTKEDQQAKQDQVEQKSSTKQEEDEHKSNTKQEHDEQKTSTKPEKTTRQRKRKASSDITESSKEMKKDEPAKEMPARRMTRAKSRHEEKPSTSKDAVVSKATKRKPETVDDLDSISTQPYKEDDMDSIATQPFVRLTRCRSTSKQSESQDSITSNNALRKTTQHNKSKNNDSSLSHNTSANGSITKMTSSERKRKAEATPSVVAQKIERKRLRSTHSQESSTNKTNSTSSTTTTTTLISMTMVDPELFQDLIRHNKGFWNVAKYPADSEILVMDKAFRTFKFLLAMARGIPIVTSKYLKKLNESKSPKSIKINDYLFTDEEFEKKHKFSLVKSLQMAKKHKLFQGYEFVMTNNILPNPLEIKAIIEASGGYVHEKNPPAAQDNQQIYLVSAKEDKKDWHKYRRINKNIIIVSTEAVMASIMRQSCERLNCYTLS